MRNPQENAAEDSLATSLVSIAERVKMCAGWEALLAQVKLADSLLWTAFQNGDLANDPVLKNRVEHAIGLADGENPEGGLAEYLTGQTVRLPNFSTEVPWQYHQECANWFSTGLLDIARQLRTASKQQVGAQSAGKGTSPGRPRKTALHQRIKDLCVEHDLAGKWAKLAELASADDEASRLNGGKLITRHVAKHAVTGRKGGESPR